VSRVDDEARRDEALPSGRERRGLLGVQKRLDASGGRGGVFAPERRRQLVAVCAAALVALVALVLVLLTRDAGDDGPGVAALSSAAPASGEPENETVAPLPPTPTPTGPTENVDEPPPFLPEVPIDALAAVGNGIAAAIASVEAIDGSAVGPGNIAGPALRITVRIENGTGEAVSLDGVAVNLSYGADHTPASPLDDPSRAPFSGMVDPGASGVGVYVFSVPTDVRDGITVEVGYQAGAPLLLFTGPVG
jgi:hypothetical protein